jgi:hypothetical protein
VRSIRAQAFDLHQGVYFRTLFSKAASSVMLPATAERDEQLMIANRVARPKSGVGRRPRRWPRLTIFALVSRIIL